MSAAHALELIARVFVYGLVLIVGWKLLTGRINLRGLLAGKSRPSQISPERVQLLVSTIVLALQYARGMGVASADTLPKVGPGSLYLLAASGVIYTARKLFERLRTS
jgi:hypothetical protein